MKFSEIQKYITAVTLCLGTVAMIIAISLEILSGFNGENSERAMAMGFFGWIMTCISYLMSLCIVDDRDVVESEKK